MKQQNLTPLLVGKEQREAQNFKRGWDEQKNSLQYVIDQFSAMGIGKLESIHDLWSLLLRTEGFIFNIQSGGGAKLTGKHGKEMETDNVMVMKMFKKPAGYDNLQKAVSELSKKSMLAEAGVRYRIADIAQYFTFDNGKLKFSAKLQTQIDDAGNCYAITEKGQALYRFLEKVCAAFKEEDIDKHFLTLGDQAEVTYRFLGLLNRIIEPALQSIDLETGKPIVIIKGTIPNLSFGGDRYM